jgi:hypothetical protein
MESCHFGTKPGKKPFKVGLLFGKILGDAPRHQKYFPSHHHIPMSILFLLSADSKA